MSDEWHECHFCGDYVKDGKDAKGKPHKLADCRPDLVPHEPGPLCTWSYLTTGVHNCYAFQDKWTNEWTDQHTHFYPEDAYT